MIVEGVVAEGDAAEVAGLEAKSAIDISKKGLGIAKVAKFILGAANRAPDDAKRYFQGYAVMVLGAQQGEATGVPAGVEAHELRDRLNPYLGPNGPNWDLSRLPLGPGREVLFVVVDPPKVGTPPYPCHKNYQPADKQDGKHALVDGALYIRDKSNTRVAQAGEVTALFERGRAADAPQISIELTCGGSAIALRDSDEMLNQIIENASDDYRARRAEREQRPRSAVPLFNSPNLYGLPATDGPPEPIDEVLAKYDRRIRSNWNVTLTKLVSTTWPNLSFTVSNLAASYLASPEMIITIDGAFGIDKTDLDRVKTADVLPPVVPRVRSPFELTPLELPTFPVPGISWENTEVGLEIRLTPEALRPQTPWVLRDSDLVVLVASDAVDALHGEWSFTAEGSGERVTGDIVVPIDPDASVRTCYQKFAANKRR